MLKAVEWKQKKLFVIDQTKLPGSMLKIQLRTVAQVMDAIQQRKVRGSSLLGSIAAFAVYLAVKQTPLAKNFEDLLKDVEKVSTRILKLQPISMDIEWALAGMKHCVLNHRDYKLSTLRDIILREAVNILKAYEAAGKTMVENSLELIRDGDCVLTYGNAGALSAPGSGSALGIIIQAAAKKNISVIVPETRPLMEGARLTAVELKHAKIPFQLIADNASASLMKEGIINIVMIGARRIAMNGDIAATIGTYGLAMQAYQHRIPVYVAAPASTFDCALISGESIAMEKRKTDELLKWNNKPISIPGVKALNPAFDLTPHKYISALITDLGIIRAPYDQNLKNLFLNH